VERGVLSAPESRGGTAASVCEALGTQPPAAQRPIWPLAVVQGSLFGAGAPLQLPLSSQTPGPKHAVFGSHAVPAERLTSWQPPVAGSHEGTLHGPVAAGHVAAASSQEPYAHWAPIPHLPPGSQEVPFGFGALMHWPVVASQTPRVQGLSIAVQSLGLPEHLPFAQVPIA